MMEAGLQRELFSIPIAEVVPPVRAVLRSQGIPPDIEPNWRTVELAEEAEKIFRQLARPVGVWLPISVEEFTRMLAGEGLNAEATPVEDTVVRADDLALFAVTVGSDLPRVIGDLFARQDPALGSMLDSYASEGVELAADLLEQRFVESLKRVRKETGDFGVLRYSPGYCGWDVSGQRRLFAILQPRDVGISLRESCLMQPLKSISGVLIGGRREIFDFENTFDFCDECTTWVCRERIAVVSGGSRDGAT